MKLLLQRVTRGSVRTGGEIAGEIGPGLVALAGFGAGDTAAKLEAAAEKVVRLRIFSDDAGRFSRSLLDTGGGILLVPQFTLYADTAKGRRPDFTGALAPQEAARLFAELVDAFAKYELARVAQGRFGAHMEVELVNDGPVTIMIEL